MSADQPRNAQLVAGLTTDQAKLLTRNRFYLGDIRKGLSELELLNVDVHVHTAGRIAERDDIRIRRTGHTDPTLDTIRQDEKYHAELEDYTELLESIASFVQSAVIIARRKAHRGAPRRYTEPAGTGNCEHCGRYCQGTYVDKATNQVREDRLRGGLCDASRKRWERAGRPERTRVVIDPDKVTRGDPRTRVTWAGDTLEEWLG